MPEKDAQIHLRIKQEEKEKLDAYAKEKGRDMSSILREHIKKLPDVRSKEE
jgi:predicted DNA-binding protein